MKQRIGNRSFEDLQRGISDVLGASIDPEMLDEMIRQESEGRLNNALSRAEKGEKGAVTFLENCFPDSHIKGQRQQNHHQAPPVDDYPMPEEDRFPAEMNQHRAGPAADTRAEQRREKEEYIGHHVYGGKGALYFQADFKEKHNLHTLAVDAAPSAGIRKYSWDKKIRLQLTQEELPEFAAVLLSMAPYTKLSNHGPGNNKALEIEDQGTHFFVQVYGPGQAVSVKILPNDAFYAAQILIRQMLQNAPWLDSSGVFNLIKMTVANRLEDKRQNRSSGRQRQSYR